MKQFVQLALLILVGMVFVAGTASSQEGMPPMGPPPEMKEVDFLVGTWDVAMNWYMDTVKIESKGTATYSKILNGAALQMDFSGQMMGMPFNGLQLFTYDRETKQWQEIWVDDMSARITIYTGTRKDSTLVVQGEDRYMGQAMLVRMTSYNETPTSFDWKMEYSVDSGKTWQLSGTAIYTKKKQ